MICSAVSGVEMKGKRGRQRQKIRRAAAAACRAPIAPYFCRSDIALRTMFHAQPNVAAGPRHADRRGEPDVEISGSAAGESHAYAQIYAAAASRQAF